MSYYNLDNLILDIINTHKNISTLWKRSKYYQEINLAKKHIADIMDIERHPEYLEYIFQHRNFLFETTIEYGIKLERDGYESRVKTQNSIQSKINTYMGVGADDRRALGGKVPINKCLNDLFGIRFVFSDNSNSLEDICKHLEQTFSNLKIHNSCKNGYKGIHVYFKDDNYTFQWELQVWNPEDVESNRISHNKYKQEYTKWENESEEGG